MSHSSEMNTVLVTAYAKAPQGSSMYELYKHAGIVLEIDLQTDRIVDAEFTFVTDLAKRFFRRLVIGYSLTEVDELIQRIEKHYFAPSVDSVITALKSASKRYAEKKQALMG